MSDAKGGVFMDYTWLLWFLLAIIFAVIEVATTGFFIIWFGIGALGAMVVALLTSSITIQFFVFIIISVALLFMTRKLTSKVESPNATRTNVDAVIGKTGIVTEDIPALESPGIVKVAGEMWSAVSFDSLPIKKGHQVKVLQVKGVRLVVQTLISEKE